ncbi:MAG: flagellar hook-length control protein FliK [Sedimentisphaerales bacterium]|nr:flagellar hook-length control protein FliK [Sedimentisphaerales bacterium]
MSTSVTIIDGAVAAARSDGPTVRVSDGQPVDQPERLFADVQAAARARAESKPDNSEEKGVSGSSSVESEELPATVGEPVADLARTEQGEADGEEGIPVLDGGPEVVSPEIAGEAAEIGAATPSVAEVAEGRPLDGSGVAMAATVEIKPAEPVLVQGYGAAVEAQAIDTQGVSDKVGPGAMAENVVPGEGGRIAPDTLSADSIPGVPAKAGAEAPTPVDGAPEQNVAGDSSLVSAEGRIDGVKAVEEPPVVQRDGEAAGYSVGEDPALEGASAAEQKPGETSRQPGPEAVEPVPGAWREIEKSVDDREGESRSRDGADNGALFAQPGGVAASQTSEEQAGSSNFSASVNTAASPGGLMEPDSPAAPQQSAAQILTPGSAQEAKLANATPSIREQILDSMQVSLARGDRQLVVRLHPPELGNVVVRFQGGDGQIDAMLEVSKAETRYEVEQALPQVVKGLHDSGVHITRFEVVMADESERDLAEEQTQQKAWSEQQNSDPDGDRMGRPAGLGRSAGDGGHQRHVEYAGTGLPPVGQATDHIDLLV